jgi:hypothetical protein
MDDPVELELEQLQQQANTPDPTIEKLRQSDPEEAYKLEIDRLRQSNARLLAIQRQERLRIYRSELEGEFPYAPAEFITGQTRQEMRRAAERLHKANEAIFAKLVEKAAGTLPTTPINTATAPVTSTPSTQRNTQPADARAPAWGAPPAMASETVTAGSAIPWEEVKARARDVAAGNMDRAGNKYATKKEILQEVMKNGPRQMESPQQSFSLRARRQLTGQETGRPT